MQAASVRINWGRADIAAAVSADPIAAVRAILSVGDAGLDYARVKLAFDQLIDPARAVADTMTQLDRMADAARRLAGPSASADSRLAVLRRFLYVAGPWNDHRPVGYDHDDPLGQRIDNKLLATYLATRRGNCVSMPALFLILADKLALDVALVAAPLHVFVRYRSESGRVIFRIEFTEKYPSPALIPPALRERYLMLVQQNRSTFEAAEALGWEPVA